MRVHNEIDIAHLKPIAVVRDLIAAPDEAVEALTRWMVADKSRTGITLDLSRYGDEFRTSVMIMHGQELLRAHLYTDRTDETGWKVEEIRWG